MLHIQSGLDDHLRDKLYVDGLHYCVYEDSGFSEEEYLEVLFVGSHLTQEEKAFNKAMAAARITVVWLCKK